MKGWLLVLMVATWSGSVLGQINNYCQLFREHTLCINQGLGPTCRGQVQFRGIRDTEAAFIVGLHNQFRSRVALGQEGRGSPGPQPQAANMRVLEWDQELANVAQSHADQCIFEHECSDCRRVSRFGVGQNLFLTMQSQFNDQIQWERAIRIWFDEVTFFNSRSVVPFRFSEPTGHYSMMMWSNSQKIGCGFTMSRDGYWWKKLYTCNYGPGGNILSSEMYRPGPPCSACPGGTTCSQQYPGLCEDIRAFDATFGSHPSPDLPLGPAVHFDANYGIPRIPFEPVSTTSGINVFGDHDNIFRVSPAFENIAALIDYFHNRRRGMKGVPFIDVLRCIFQGRQNCSATATVTASPLPVDNVIMSATPSSQINATSSVLSTITQLTIGISVQESSTLNSGSENPVSSADTASSANTATAAAITPSSVLQTSADIATSVSTSDTTTTTTATDTTTIFDIAANSVTSLHTGAIFPSEVSTVPPTEGTVTTVPYHHHLPTKVSTLPVLTTQQDEALELQEPQKVEIEHQDPQRIELEFLEPVKVELELQEPTKVEFDLAEQQKVVLEHPASEAQQQEEQFNSPNRDHIEDSDLMPFLQRAGVNKDVVHIDSLSSVQRIINSLPNGVTPIVLYRSALGKISELDPGTLQPISRFGQTSASAANTHVELLTCDLDASPCNITPVGASWKISSSLSEGRYLEASLGERQVAQLAFQEVVGAPSGNGICVAVSHRRTLADGAPSNATIPDLKVIIMPVDGDFKMAHLGGTSGQWEMSLVSFSDIKAKFLVALSVPPASFPATVAIDALMITDGLCCVSGLC